jgi:hypothetical protein
VSTGGITSSLLSQIVGSPATANQFASDLNQLAEDLQNGNLSSSQQDYVTLSEDALNATASSSTATTTSSGITPSLLSSIASSSSSSDSFVGELNQLGADLGNNDLPSAMEDMLALSTTALNAASSASTGSASSSGSSTTNQVVAGQPVSAALQMDVKGIIAAMSAGDTSAEDGELAQLASDAGSSPGASYLKALSETSSSSLGGGTTSTAPSVTELLPSVSGTSTSLNLLA